METYTYDYHVKEWEAFAKEVEADPEDLAISFWDDFEEMTREVGAHPYDMMQYSAGVYLGEVETIMRPRRALWTETPDEVTVALWLDDCDAYADAGEAFIRDYISFHSLDVSQMDETALAYYGLMVTHLMERDLPEFIEVFYQWNYWMPEAELREELLGSNMATLLDCVPVA
jgi:hypothetical protein